MPAGATGFVSGQAARHAMPTRRVVIEGDGYLVTTLANAAIAANLRVT